MNSSQATAKRYPVPNRKRVPGTFVSAALRALRDRREATLSLLANARSAVRRTFSEGVVVNKWQALQPGDIIDVVAPGFSCKPEELQAAVSMVQGWGFIARVPKNIFQRDLLHSSPDAFRAKHLVDSLTAKDSKAVWCVRGGYGAIRLLPQLSKTKRPNQSKLFIGLSDITSLHTFLNQVWKWPTIHGPMMDRLGKGTTPKRYVTELLQMVSGEQDEISFTGLKPLNEAARKNKVVRGQISGGNLVTIQSTLGTPYQWKPAGGFMFLEDIGERAYRVDRVLEHFRQAGLYKGVRGIILGDFTGGHDPDGKDRVPAALQRFADSISVPVLKGIKSGHGPIQRPVPFGSPAVLHLGKRHELIVKSGVSKAK